MFKFSRNPNPGGIARFERRGRSCRVGLLLAGALVVAGCRSLPPFPAVDLEQPGWNVRKAQVLWQKSVRDPQIVGELLLANGPEGRCYVQFTKSPFPLLTAQRTPGGWELRLPAQNRRYSRPGPPPGRLILLHLPELIAGENPPRGWTWEVLPEGGWRVRHERSGESLEGHWVQ